MVDRPVTAVMLDNHRMMIEGVQRYLDEAEPPVLLVAASDRLIDAWTGPGGAADVVIFDLGFIREDCFEFKALEDLVRKGRNVVVFSHNEESETALRSVRLGAKSYVTKVEGPKHLVPAILAAARGEKYTAPKHAGAIAADDSVDRPQFPAGELAALKAWCTGISKAGVAKRLGVAESTVRTYIARARNRYDDVGRPARTKEALTARLIEDDHLALGDVQGRFG